MRAVRFDQYGGPEVLEVRDVDDPVLGDKEVIVRIRATGINPGEMAIREGALHEMWPATFPSGEGSDLAGEVVEAVPGSPFKVGDAVLGWTDQRAAHAELASVAIAHLIHKPEALSFEVAGSLYVAGLAGLAGVRAVDVTKGDTVVVSAAAGGVGMFSAQLARAAGATVIGLAGTDNHEWLTSRGIIPVAYGDGQEDRIRAVVDGPVDALIDTFGGGYVELGVSLGVAPERINTVIDFAAAAKVEGVRTEGTQSQATANGLAELADAVADGDVEVPIAATFPLDQVRDAYEELARRHTRGKIVLIP